MAAPGLVRIEVTTEADGTFTSGARFEGEAGALVASNNNAVRKTGIAAVVTALAADWRGDLSLNPMLVVAAPRGVQP